MSKAIAITAKGSPVTVKGTWDGAREWLSAAGRFEQCKLFCQVMLGFELLELKKLNGVSHGNNQHQGRTSHDEKSTSQEPWDEILKRETGVSAPTAYRYMDMAKAATPRLRKLPSLHSFDPMSKALADLSEPQQKALETGVRKLTDAKTQQEFAGEMGLWKGKSGNTTNHQSGGDKKKKLTPEEVRTTTIRMARENAALARTAVEASLNNFYALTEDNDLEVDALIGTYETATKIMKKWIALPKAKRDPAIIKQLIKEAK